MRQFGGLRFDICSATSKRLKLGGVQTVRPDAVMRPAAKPLGSTLQPGQSQPQSSFAAICRAGAPNSIRSLTFRTVAVSASICFCWRAVRPRNQSITLKGRPYFPCAVLGRIDTGAHGGKLVIHAEEASNL